MIRDWREEESNIIDLAFSILEGLDGDYLDDLDIVVYVSVDDDGYVNIEMIDRETDIKHTVTLSVVGTAVNG